MILKKFSPIYSSTRTHFKGAGSQTSYQKLPHKKSKLTLPSMDTSLKYQNMMKNFKVVNSSFKKRLKPLSITYYINKASDEPNV